MGRQLVPFRTIVTAVFVVVACGDTAAGPDTDGAPHDQGDHAAVLYELRPSAELGHARTQNSLWNMYYAGRGVARITPKPLLGIVWQRNRGTLLPSTTSDTCTRVARVCPRTMWKDLPGTTWLPLRITMTLGKGGTHC